MLRTRLTSIVAGVSILLAGCAANTAQSPSATTVATPTPGSMMADDSVYSPTGREGGHMMSPVDSTGVPAAPADAKGAQLLSPRLDGDTKVFDLTAKPIRWPLGQGVVATAWTYNGTVPGPLIRVTEGDKLRVVLKNELPEQTTIHWHGMEVPIEMDGVPDMPTPAIKPGETFTYEFVAKPAGTFWYHSHVDGDRQVSIGLFAPIIVDPKTPAGPRPDVDKIIMLNEWRVVGNQTVPAMPMTGMDANFFAINGKIFPDTETISVKLGQRVRLRFVGAGQLVHPMHLHGMPFKIVATDGHPVPETAQLTKDTVAVAPGERYDVEFVATERGQWMLHCHVLHHTTNDGAEPGGLMMIVNVT
ncbi:MAG: copper oxidase [Chloroflexi bacterium]|nr:copper oxidase [Chloroflexota bacterium]